MNNLARTVRAGLAHRTAVAGVLANKHPWMRECISNAWNSSLDLLSNDSDLSLAQTLVPGSIPTAYRQFRGRMRNVLMGTCAFRLRKDCLPIHAGMGSVFPNGYVKTNRRLGIGVRRAPQPVQGWTQPVRLLVRCENALPLACPHPEHPLLARGISRKVRKCQVYFTNTLQMGPCLAPAPNRVCCTRITRARFESAGFLFLLEPNGIY